MKMISAVIELPDDLYHILASHGLSKEVISKESKKLLALKCYKDKILSLGKSAELSGLSMRDFIEFLSKNDVAVIDYSEEQLNMELKVVDKLRKVSKI
jgi:predicted HTH domain antitoxin